jgi:hypothetical protein
MGDEPARRFRDDAAQEQDAGAEDRADAKAKAPA